MHDKPIDLWAQLTTVDAHNEKDGYMTESNILYDDEMAIPDFEKEIITGDESKMSNPGIVFFC